MIELNQISYMLPEDAWSFLVWISGMETSWALPLTREPNLDAGKNYLQEEGYLLLDRDHAMLDPVLNKISKLLANTLWTLSLLDAGECLSLLYCDERLFLAFPMPAMLIKLTAYTDLREAYNDVQTWFNRCGELPVEREIGLTMAVSEGYGEGWSARAERGEALAWLEDTLRIGKTNEEEEAADGKDYRGSDRTGDGDEL